MGRVRKSNAGEVVAGRGRTGHSKTKRDGWRERVWRGKPRRQVGEVLAARVAGQVVCTVLLNECIVL